MSVLSTSLSPTHSFRKHPQPSITLLEGLGVKGDCHCGAKTQHLYLIDRDKKQGNPQSSNIRQVHLIQGELYAEDGFCGVGGQRIGPGGMGENITTLGVGLGGLGRGTRLVFVRGEAEEVGEEGLWTRFSVLMNVMLFAALIGVKKLVEGVMGGGRWVDVLVMLCLLLQAAYFLTQHWKRIHENGPPVIALTGQRRPCKKIDEHVGLGLTEHCLVKEDKKIVGAKAGVMGVVEVGGIVRPGMKIVVEEPEVWEALPLV